MLGGGPQPINVPDDQGKRPPVRGPEDPKGRWSRLLRKTHVRGGFVLFGVIAIFLFIQAIGSGQYN